MAGFNLTQILSPLSREEFLTRIYSEQFCYIPGGSSKFDGLLSWQELNRVLATQRLEPPRLRLALEASAEELGFVSQHAARRGGQIPKLELPDLYRHLRAGATLILDAIDEAVPTVRDTCETLIGEFGTDIQVNAYFATGASPGFGLHWDDHDVIVLQLFGAKRWQIYGPTRQYPLFRDTEPNSTKPTEVQWENTISAGDVLYIPRGHWHDACAINEASLHVTFGINNPTAITLLTWMTDRLRDYEVLRQDIKQFGPEDEKIAQTEAIRTAVLEFLSDDAIERFISSRRSSIRSRAHLSLPYAAGENYLPSSGDFFVAFSGTSYSDLCSREEEISLRALGRTWSFRKDAQAIIVALLQGDPIPFSTLHEISPNLKPTHLRGFISHLLSEDFIYLIAP